MNAAPRETGYNVRQAKELKEKIERQRRLSAESNYAQSLKEKEPEVAQMAPKTVRQVELTGADW